MYKYCPKCKRGYTPSMIYNEKYGDSHCIYCWTTLEIFDSKAHFNRNKREQKLKRILNETTL